VKSRKCKDKLLDICM